MPHNLSLNLRMLGMEITEIFTKFKEAKNPVLFLGAGISRSYPSSIPLFSELMSAFLNAIDNGHFIPKQINNIPSMDIAQYDIIKRKFLMFMRWQ